MNIDLGKIVTALGEDTIADIGAPLGLSKELSLKAARSLAENFHGNSDEAIAAKMHACGESLPPEVSELERFGLHALPSQTVKPPRIAEAPVAFECVLHEKLETESRYVFIGRVQWLHARDGLVDAAVLPVRGRSLGTLVALGAGVAVRALVLALRGVRGAAGLAGIGAGGADADAEQPGESESGGERRCARDAFDVHSVTPFGRNSVEYVRSVPTPSDAMNSFFADTLSALGARCGSGYESDTRRKPLGNNGIGSWMNTASSWNCKGPAERCSTGPCVRRVGGLAHICGSITGWGGTGNPPHRGPT